MKDTGSKTEIEIMQFIWKKLEEEKRNNEEENIQ